MISWGAAKTTDVTAGTYDDYIRSTATAIKDLGSPVFLRWFWEMDGTDFAAQAVNPDDVQGRLGAHPRDLRLRRRHQCGLGLVPHRLRLHTGLAQPFYPGDSLVDWVAADGFNSYPDVART